MNKKLTFLFASILMAGAASADNIYVDASSATNGAGTETSPKNNLRSVVNGASSGDVIYFKGTATLNGRMDIKSGKTLTIVGWGENATDNIIDGSGTYQLFDIGGASTATFKNLTFKDGFRGDNVYGGGALCINGGTATVEDCAFESNVTALKATSNPGGAIYGSNSVALTIKNSTFTGNKGYQGGAVAVSTGSLTMENCTFDGNNATVASGVSVNVNQNLGGALYLNNVNATVTGCTFKDNVAEGHGGAIGIYENAADKTVTFQNCKMLSNKAGGTAFANNGSGGGVFINTNAVANAIVNFYACTIAGNQCKSQGGAVNRVGDSGNNRGAETQQINFINCTITGNSTQDNRANGGGLTMFDLLTKINIINCIVEGNTAAGQNNASGDAWFARWYAPTNVTAKNSVFGYVHNNNASVTANGSTFDGRITPDGNNLINASALQAGLTQVSDFYLPSNATAAASLGVAADAASYVTTDADGRAIATVPGAVQKVVVATGNAGMAAFCSGNAVNFDGVEGLTAYKAKVADNAAYLTAVTAAPAKTGLVLETSAESVVLPVVASADAVADNELVGVTAKTTPAAKDGYTNFVLSKEDGTLGFYKFPDNGAIAAMRAYLPVANASDAKLGIAFGEVPTGINAVSSAADQASKVYYTLAGQRVAHPTKGIYIVNGKKVFCKVKENNYEEIYPAHHPRQSY